MGGGGSISRCQYSTDLTDIIISEGYCKLQSTELSFLSTTAIKFEALTRNFFAWFEILLIPQNKRFWHLCIVHVQIPLVSASPRTNTGHHTYTLFITGFIRVDRTKWPSGRDKYNKEQARTTHNQVSVNTEIWKLKLLPFPRGRLRVPNVCQEFWWVVAQLRGYLGSHLNCLH